MQRAAWTQQFPGWEQGTYHGHRGVFRRRADGLSIRLLAETRTDTEDRGDSPDDDPQWLLSFWRMQDSETYHVLGAPAQLLGEVLAWEDVTVDTILTELNRRFAMVAWTAGESGFERTGLLAHGGTPPDRPGTDWMTTLEPHGWARVDDAATRRVGQRRLHVRVEVPDPGLDFTPSWWTVRFETAGSGGLRRLLGGDPAYQHEAMVYLSPWHDTDLFLGHLAGLGTSGNQDSAAPQDLADWLRTSTDASVHVEMDVAPAAPVTG